MKILFVGINPHYGSFRRGIPFSNNKMFWYLLNRSGLIKEDLRHLRDDKTLKRIYMKKFNQVYKLGFVNLVNRPTRNVSQLKNGEENKGRNRALRIIEEYEPSVVCFIGRIAFEKFAKTKEFSFGWQCRKIFRSKSFVMHFPIRGKAIVRIRELKNIICYLVSLRKEGVRQE